MKIKSNYILKKLKSDLLKSFPKNTLLADSRGFVLSKKPCFSPLAQKAITSNRIQKEGSLLYWFPIFSGDKTIGAVRLSGTKTSTTRQLALINGFLDELTYLIFLQRELLKLPDSKSEFLKKLLLDKSIITMEEAIDRGDIVGVNLRCPQAIILIKLPNLFKKWYQKYKRLPTQERNEKLKWERDNLIRAYENAFQNHNQNVFSFLAEDTIVCLKCATGKVTTLNTIKFYKKKGIYLRDYTENHFNIKPTIGIGQYYPGINGLIKSYHDAYAAIEVGEKIWGPGKVYHITEIGTLLAVSNKLSLERKCEIALQILEPILKNEALKKTVLVFISSNLNLSEAAQKLHLHRNTLIYRLNKVKKLTGLDPKKFSDAVKIKLGLLFCPLSKTV